MKSKISRIFTFLGSLMLIALLFSFISWFLNGGLNTFSVGYDDTIFTKDTENVSIIESGTFTVHYKDEDTNDIKAKLIAVELYEDFYFQADGITYSWNANVVRSKIQNFTDFVEITIDQEKNTVTVTGSLLSALQKAGNTEDIVLLSTLPNEDMFRLSIESGDTVIEIGCRIQSSVLGIIMRDNLQISI